jgi:hypothetical protein
VQLSTERTDKLAQSPLVCSMDVFIILFYCKLNDVVILQYC